MYHTIMKDKDGGIPAVLEIHDNTMRACLAVSGCVGGSCPTRSPCAMGQRVKTPHPRPRCTTSGEVTPTGAVRQVPCPAPTTARRRWQRQANSRTATVAAGAWACGSFDWRGASPTSLRPAAMAFRCLPSLASDMRHGRLTSSRDSMCLAMSRSAIDPRSR